MDDSTKQNFVDLYNDAVLRIFPTKTMVNIFGEKLTTDAEGNNKMILPTSDTKVEEKIKKKEVFLDFMKKNFQDIRDNTPDDVAKLLDVNKNVKKFIERMEVKTIFKGGVYSYVVTLHDIIGKFVNTSIESDHCKSEKLFMAILLAIQIYNNSYPDNNKIIFRFQPSSYGKSGLHKSSDICSGKKDIELDDDNVDLKKIFVFDGVDDLIAAAQAAQVAQAEVEAAAEAKAAAEAEAKAAAEAEAAAEAAAEAKAAAEAEAAAEAAAEAKAKEEAQKKAEHEASISASEWKRQRMEDALNTVSIRQERRRGFWGDLLLKRNGGSKSRRRHRRKPARKTRRGRTRTRKSKSKSKSKPKTHRRRRHSRVRVRKHKKYTSRRRR